MVSYRYLLCDLLTDQPLAVLPLTGVSFDRRISRTGSLSASLAAARPADVAKARLLYQYAGRSALWVYRDDAIWWAGIPWTVTAGQDDRGPVELSVQAATFDSYAHRRRLLSDVTYTQVDQGVIIPDLWRTIQTDPRGDIGVVAEDQPTGTLRDRTYRGADQSFVGKLIEQLGDVIDGPEHTIDTYLDNGQRVKRLRVADRLGRMTPRTVFQRTSQRGGRVLSWAYSGDATEGGTRFQTRGDAPNGNVGQEKQPLLSAPVEATALLDAGWPLLDVLEDYSGVKDTATLDGHAQALASERAGASPTSGYSVQVGNTGWSPNRVGDPVRIKISDNWHQSSDVTVRPVGCKVSAAEAGTPETVELLLSGDE